MTKQILAATICEQLQKAVNKQFNSIQGKAPIQISAVSYATRIEQNKAIQMVKDMVENLLVNVFDREIANNTLVTLLGESLDKVNGSD